MEDSGEKTTNPCKVSGREVLCGYISLLRNNKTYRLYLSSLIFQQVGDWIVRIASLAAVEELAPGSSTAISILVMAKIIPEVIVTPLGGLLADRFDRKLLMVYTDCSAGCAAFYFILAYRSGDVTQFYIATILRSILSSMDKAAEHSIVPMFVSDPEDLKRLVTLYGLAWSSMLIFGGFLVGCIVATVGFEACYIIDSSFSLLSALFMYKVPGNFIPTTASNQNKDDNIDIEAGNNNNSKETEKKSAVAKLRAKLRRIFSPLRSTLSMTKEMCRYLWTCGFGALVFMKASGTVTWGSEDVLNVLFSQVPDDEDESSRRLGIIYSSQGIGCLIGPMLATSFIIDGKKPHTMQLACICGLLFVIGGWLGIANAPSFELICFFSFVRCLGGSTIWLYSTLLLQNLVNVGMLGRVISLESATASLFEAAIAYVAGRLEDEGVSKHEIALLSAGIGSLLLMFWSTYHVFGKGAPRSIQQENAPPVEMEKDTGKETIQSSDVDTVHAGSINMMQSPLDIYEDLGTSSSYF